MSTEFKWDERKREAAHLFAADEQTQEEIAKAVGVHDRTLRNWLHEREFKNEVARLQTVYAGVAESIRQRMEQAKDHPSITRAHIVGRLVEIANASLTDFLDDDGELDLKKARRSQKAHLLKKITVVKRTSRDGSSRITKNFEIESPLQALDLLADITGIKREPGKNPEDILRATYQSMRSDARYADLPEEDLARLVGVAVNRSAEEVLAAIK